MIVANFQKHPVEVIDINDHYGRGKWANVEFLDGYTVSVWTHDGWAEYKTALVPVKCLKDVQVVDPVEWQMDQDRREWALETAAMAHGF